MPYMTCRYIFTIPYALWKNRRVVRVRLHRKAARLTRAFLDTDAVIEQEAGLTIPQLFARYGEADFRAREREVCRRLAMPQGRVVAALSR